MAINRKQVLGFVVGACAAVGTMSGSWTHADQGASLVTAVANPVLQAPPYLPTHSLDAWSQLTVAFGR